MVTELKGLGNSIRQNPDALQTLGDLVVKYDRGRATYEEILAHIRQFDDGLDYLHSLQCRRFLQGGRYIGPKE
jgi:hypothetical protein